MTADLERLERRLARLEGERRWIRRVGLLLLLCLTTPFLLGQSEESSTVEGERFVLKDAEGRERARLQVPVAGAGPELVLLDGEGRPRARLGVTSQGIGEMALLDKKGRPRVDATGHGQVRVLDPGADSGVQFDFLGDGNPQLQLFKEKGGTLYVGIDESGKPVLLFSDDEGNDRVELSFFEKKTDPTFLLKSKDGRILFRAP